MTAGKIYYKQGMMVLDIDTEQDLSSATSVKIKYRKPKGKTGFWVPTSTDGSHILYTVTNNTFDETGIWQFQAYIAVGGLSGWGEPFSLEIHATI